MGISFSGLSSGLDTDLIVESLLVRHQQKINSIQERIDQNNTQKRALTDLKTTLNTFGDILGDLESNVFEKRGVTSSDEKAFTASVLNSDAAVAEYEINVIDVAQRSTAKIGGALASATEVIGSGTLTLNLGSGSELQTLSVNLGDAGSTLTDLRDAINEQYGDTLNANIIEVDPNSSARFQLVVTTKNAGDNLNIQEAGDTNESTTSFASNATFDVGVDRTRDGKDAHLVVDGLDIYRDTNEITDVIEGVQLNIKGTTSGNESLSVEKDTAELVSGLQEFVNGYNDAISRIEKLAGAEGTLQGDSSLLGLKRGLQSLISRSVDNIASLNTREDGSTGFTSLSQIGFKTDRTTGKLTIDEDELKDALTDHFDEVKNLFLGAQESSNSNVTIAANTGNPFSGSITLDTLADTATIDSTVYNLNRDGNVLSFQSGSAFDGMIFFVGQEDSNVTFNVSAGLSADFGNILDQFTSFSGILDDRSSSLDSRNRELDRGLETAQDRLENERTRLTAVFAKAEQAISTLQGLQSSLTAQSGS